MIHSQSYVIVKNKYKGSCMKNKWKHSIISSNISLESQNLRAEGIPESTWYSSSQQIYWPSELPEHLKYEYFWVLPVDILSEMMGGPYLAFSTFFFSFLSYFGDQTKGLAHARHQLCRWAQSAVLVIYAFKRSIGRYALRRKKLHTQKYHM